MRPDDDTASGGIFLRFARFLLTTSALTLSFASGAAAQTLTGDVTGPGPQVYDEAVTLDSDVRLTSTDNGGISFNNTVDGAHTLTVNTGGVTTFGANVGSTTALTSVTTNAGGATHIHGNVTTTGAQTFGDAVILGSDTAFTSAGGGTITFGGTVETDYRLTVQTASEAYFTGVVAGDGGISQAGSGTMLLSASNTYRGDTRLLGGVISVASDANLGDGSSKLFFNGGTLQNTVSFTSARAVTLGAGGGTFKTDKYLELSGSISGDGPLIKEGADTLALTGDNVVGLFNVHNGTLLVNGGSLAQVNEEYVQNFIGEKEGDDATLIITNGGTVSSVHKVHIGDSKGSRGEVVVTGDESSLSVGDMTIGFDGEGSLSVLDGGSFSTVTFMNVGGGNFNRQGTGHLLVDGAGSSVTIGDQLLIAPWGDGSSGTVTLSNGGVLEVGTPLSMGASNASGSAELNIGAASTDAADAVAAGTLVAPEIQFYAANTSLNFNHTDSAYAFAAELASSGGAGFVNHYAGNTNLTGDSSGFSGATTVYGGALSVDGSLGGTAKVLAGGRLGGSGTVGATTVKAGGILAPGNSIGTIHAGSLAFEADGIYEVELKNGGNTAGVHNDVTIASNVVTIDSGAVLHVRPENGTDTGVSYVPGLTYTVIQSVSEAEAGVDGRFGSLTDDYLFLDFVDSYDSHNVYLTSQLTDMSFCLGGLTANQCATAEGVQDSAPSPMFTAIVNLTDPGAAAAAFDGLSGEIHASAKTALIEDSRFVRDAVNERLRAAFGGIGTTAMPVLAYGESGHNAGVEAAFGRMGAAADTGRLAAWGSVFGSWGKTDGDGNAAGLTRSTGGFLTGIDGMVTEAVRLGILAGYSHDSFDVDARASSGSSDNYHLGLYGGTQRGALGLRGGIAYTWHKLSTSRSAVFPGFSERLEADYDAGTFQAFGEAGYRIDTATASFEPFANLAHVSLRTGAFTEKGGAAALASPSQTTDTTFTTLGVRASTVFSLGATRATARGMVGWRHAFGDIVPSATHDFARSGLFTIAGVPIARNAAVLEAGLDFAVSDNATLGVSYSGQFGSGARDNSAKADFSIRF